MKGPYLIVRINGQKGNFFGGNTNYHGLLRQSWVLIEFVNDNFYLYVSNFFITRNNDE